MGGGGSRKIFSIWCQASQVSTPHGGAQWLVCWGCAGCGRMCRLRVSGAQWLVSWGCAGCCGGRLTVFAVPTPPSSGRPQPASLRFRAREAQVPCSPTRCPGRPPPPPSETLVADGQLVSSLFFFLAHLRADIRAVSLPASLGNSGPHFRCCPPLTTGCRGLNTPRLPRAGAQIH